MVYWGFSSIGLSSRSLSTGSCLQLSTPTQKHKDVSFRPLPVLSFTRFGGLSGPNHKLLQLGQPYLNLITFLVSSVLLTLAYPLFTHSTCLTLNAISNRDVATE
jgi:hypothetical protein